MDKIIKAYAHDFRDMKMTEDELEKMLTNFGNEIAEKIINDIPDNVTLEIKERIWVPEINDYGEEIGIIGAEEIKQQLKTNY